MLREDPERNERGPSPYRRLAPALAVAASLLGLAGPVWADERDCEEMRQMQAWEVRTELAGRELHGYSLNTDARWSERLHKDGVTEFRNARGEVTMGRWRLSGDEICFSYGTMTEWSCKTVHRVPMACELFRYALIDDRGRVASAIYEVRALGDGPVRDGERYGERREDGRDRDYGGGSKAIGRSDRADRDPADDRAPRDDRGDRADADGPDALLGMVPGGAAPRDDRRPSEDRWREEDRGPRDDRRAETMPSDRERPRNRDREPEGELAGTGTGFVVDAEGAIMTNAHVVRGCRSVTIGEGTPAEIVAVDDEVDLAVVRAEGGPYTAIAEFAEDPARLNSDVTVIGYPLHGILGGINVTRGAVSSPTGLGGRANEFQISAAVQPGNSGGPVLNATGAVVGVVRSKLNAMRMADVTGDIPQNINFAIRGAAAKVFLVSNGIFYRTATTDERLAPADLAVSAQGFTVLINCLE